MDGNRLRRLLEEMDESWKLLKGLDFHFPCKYYGFLSTLGLFLTEEILNRSFQEVRVERLLPEECL